MGRTARYSFHQDLLSSLGVGKRGMRGPSRAGGRDGETGGLEMEQRRVNEGLKLPS